MSHKTYHIFNRCLRETEAGIAAKYHNPFSLKIAGVAAQKLSLFPINLRRGRCFSSVLQSPGIVNDVSENSEIPIFFFGIGIGTAFSEGVDSDPIRPISTPSCASSLICACVYYIYIYINPTIYTIYILLDMPIGPAQ
ncbi:hypothetical protein ACP275_13G081100 [Erythranthe tilingii]